MFHQKYFLVKKIFRPEKYFFQEKSQKYFQKNESIEKNIFRKSWIFFQTYRSKQNLTADRMRALSASENHSRSPPQNNYIFSR